MDLLTIRRYPGRLFIFLLTSAILVGCTGKQPEKVLAEPHVSITLIPALQTAIPPTPTPTPNPFVFPQLFVAGLDIRAIPVEVPLELQIPTLKVKAPVLGVGLNSSNQMDAPRGKVGDPVWHKAYWYRGSGIPGEPGTATIAGHVEDPLGRREIFYNLKQLEPGDLIIVHVKGADPVNDIFFSVDEVKDYSKKEAAEPAVLAKIYGAELFANNPAFPTPDGLSHLTLITCSGQIINGQYDKYVIVFATRTYPTD